LQPVIFRFPTKMMMRLLTFVCFAFFSVVAFAQHPVTFASQADFTYVKANLAKYPLLQNSYTELKKSVDAYLGKEVDVPFPKDAAGGYTHDRHKENYILMFNSGLLYNLTGNKQYALLVRNILLKYAALNPTLKKHPQATSSSPGHIFWQALNDANWLVYTGLGYDLIYNSLTPAERKTIEDGAFKPEVDFITKDLEGWFNLIHNHGVWACAGVGIVGIATNNKDYVQKALYGTKGDGKSGFMAQLDNLFSPDGYYTEGPYYVRYALLPFYLFANALSKARPELKIFEHRNSILKKALVSGLQQTNLDGTFFPLNDALKDKDFTTNEMVTAVDIAWEVYGKDEGLLSVAKKQGKVVPTKGGASIAAALNASQNSSMYFPYTSVEYTDGAKGDEGGVAYLRSGKNADLTTLFFKYSSHGLSHGHFDKLSFFLYDAGNEIFSDYGSARFVNIEQKWGGRYLPENTAYASQTIAHNTVVVDEKSQFDAKETAGEKYHSNKLFSSFEGKVQVVSAKEENAYKNVQLFRSLYLVQLPDRSKPVVVDLFRINATESHQYDLPFQYNGQLINTTFKYEAFSDLQKPLGKRNGYQFLWKEAQGTVKDTIAQFTFLNNKTYYSVSSLVQDTAQVFFTRIGANDPNFNLRREPAYIIRKKGTDQSFVNVLEIHGKFDPVAEFSTNSYPSVQSISLLQNDETYTIALINVKGKQVVVAQCNKDFNKQSKHNFQTGALSLEWTGPFTVLYDGKTLQ
jgi:hypothetical protein